MNKLVPFLLIGIGLVLLVLGFNDLGDSSAAVSIGDLEISATDEGGQLQAYVMMCMGLLGLIAGGVLMGRSKSA